MDMKNFYICTRVVTALLEDIRSFGKSFGGYIGLRVFLDINCKGESSSSLGSKLEYLTLNKVELNKKDLP